VSLGHLIQVVLINRL